MFAQRAAKTRNYRGVVYTLVHRRRARPGELFSMRLDTPIKVYELPKDCPRTTSRFTMYIWRIQAAVEQAPPEPAATRPGNIDHVAFVIAWQAANNLEEAAALTGMTEDRVTAHATMLRNRGVRLKKFEAIDVNQLNQLIDET